jgi:hypothetical protein
LGALDFEEFNDESSFEEKTTKSERRIKNDPQ